MTGVANRLLAENHLFHLDDLQDVVGTRLKLTRSHSLIDASQQLRVDVVSIINTCTMRYHSLTFKQRPLVTRATCNLVSLH